MQGCPHCKTTSVKLVIPFCRAGGQTLSLSLSLSLSSLSLTPLSLERDRERAAVRGDALLMITFIFILLWHIFLLFSLFLLLLLVVVVVVMVVVMVVVVLLLAHPAMEGQNLRNSNWTIKSTRIKTIYARWGIRVAEYRSGEVMQHLFSNIFFQTYFTIPCNNKFWFPNCMRHCCNM